MDFSQALTDALISLIPPILVGILFWVIMRSILRADKGERDTYAQIEAEERAKKANALGEQP
jgi:cellobiose-specific phosphotransferase system component IIC